jgi:HK97 family phage major capsid protein
MSTEKLEQAVNKLAEETGKFAAMTEKTSVRMAELEAKAKSLEEWQAKLEREHKDRRVSLYGGDNLLAAIPESLRGKVMKTAEMTCKAYKSGNVPQGMPKASIFLDDPILKAGASLWLANHLIKLTDPAQYMKRLDWHEKLEKELGGVHKVALQEDTAAEGGNLVPTIVESEILRLVADFGIMRPLVRKVPMTTKTHAYPTRAAAFTAAIIAEEGTISDSVPSNPFSQSSLTAKKFACFATVSGELLQDNVVLLADYLATEFGEQVARKEDQEALEGDGTNFTGVIGASGVNSITSGTNGDFLSWQKLASVPWEALEASSRMDAYWFYHPKIQQALVRSRVGAAGVVDLPFFIPPLGGLSAAAPPSILGFPYRVHSGLRTNVTAGTGTTLSNIYFGPPQTIIFGDLLGFSIELNPWAKFSSFQIDIRGLKRTGILVGVPSAWTKYIAIDPRGPMLT